MKVTLSVGGKFQAFDLARQLYKHGNLAALITSYPKFEVKKYGVPPEKVRPIIVKEILNRGWTRMPLALRKRYNPDFFINEIFDRLASFRIPETDIFTAWASFGLHSLRKANGRGAVTVCERGSSHIGYQQDLLKEEYERWGVKAQMAHPKIVEKELKEYEEADYIAIPSQFVKRSFLARGVPESKLIHVPYGVDLEWFYPVPKEDDVFRVIFGGGLTLRKGVHYLLQAWHELKLKNAELLLIGAVSEDIKPFLKKYDGSFRRSDYYPMRELGKIYSQGSVFVMPSLEEGLALVQPQAMACGLPLIGTTNSGAEDVVREGVDGFILPVKDVEALKEKIMFFYNNPDKCKEMGKSAKEHISQGFTWDDYGNRMTKEYERVLSIKQSSHE